MKLIPMSDSDYAFWKPRSLENYIQEKMKANSLTRAEAEEIGNADFNRILPNGLASKDNYLFKMAGDAPEALGYLWYCVRGPQENRRIFICDIMVEEKHRGKGYGKKAMLLAEEGAKSLGIKKIGLHVFGYNKTAIGLYQSLGYITTDLSMEKPL